MPCPEERKFDTERSIAFTCSGTKKKNSGKRKRILFNKNRDASPRKMSMSVCERVTTPYGCVDTSCGALPRKETRKMKRERERERERERRRLISFIFFMPAKKATAGVFFFCWDKVTRVVACLALIVQLWLSFPSWSCFLQCQCEQSSVRRFFFLFLTRDFSRELVY